MAYRILGLLCAVAAVVLFHLPCPADDAEANALFTEGRTLEKEEKFRRAAGKYLDARLMADDTVLKGNALIAAARAYRKAKLYGDEFDCLEKLIKEHLGGIDFAVVVDREYKIADEFFKGHRDVAVSWLPFIKKGDRTMEIYEAALKNAPCSAQAGEGRLRLARLYIDEQKPDDAIRHLNETTKLFPGSESAQYASLELSSLLLQMAERGDGDNAYSRQALEAFDNYLKTYPDSPEVPWVKKAREKVLNLMAQRIHAVGAYYHRTGQNEIAERYLAEVVKNYSNTEQANKSEDLLAEINKEYEIPPNRDKRFTPYKVEYRRGPTPGDAAPIMVVPENSGNRWLLPVRDLKKSVVREPGTN